MGDLRTMHYSKKKICVFGTHKIQSSHLRLNLTVVEGVKLKFVPHIIFGGFEQIMTGQGALLEYKYLPLGEQINETSASFRTKHFYELIVP